MSILIWINWYVIIGGLCIGKIIMVNKLIEWGYKMIIEYVWYYIDIYCVFGESVEEIKWYKYIF